MLKIYTDFNEATSGDLCWLLLYQGTDLAKLVTELRLTKGQKVLLYQDEDDFEVVATLDYTYVDMLGRDEWVARPDWSTLKRK